MNFILSFFNLLQPLSLRYFLYSSLFQRVLPVITHQILIFMKDRFWVKLFLFFFIFVDGFLSLIDKSWISSQEEVIGDHLLIPENLFLLILV